MTEVFKSTISDHPADNYRAMTTIAANLLTVAIEGNLHQLDEKLYFEVSLVSVAKLVMMEITCKLGR
jgi:general secretion pathway protein A